MEFRTNEERLVAEQAVLMYRAAHEAMAKAPAGRGLELTEAAVLEQGREYLRKMTQTLLSAHPEAQKRGRGAGSAPGVPARPSSNTSTRGG